MEDLLYEFATEQGISKNEVALFLERKKNIETINDLLNADDSLLEHESYITWVDSKIRDYIHEEMYINRYETVTLERIIDSMSLEYDDNGDMIPFEYSEYNSNYSDVIEALISSRFGSVKCDW